VRSAIVTDMKWMARATRLFAWMIPGEACVFPLAELEQAKAWVAGGARRSARSATRASARFAAAI